MVDANIGPKLSLKGSSLLPHPQNQMTLDFSTKRKQSPPAVRTTIVAVNPHRPRLFQSSMPIFLLAASPKYMDLHPLVGQDRIVFLSFVGIREHVAIIFNFSFFLLFVFFLYLLVAFLLPIHFVIRKVPLH